MALTEINISHRLNAIQFSIKNLEKYYVFSYTIDYLAFLKGIKQLDDGSKDTIVQSIKDCSRGRISKEEWINRWIAELMFMEIIACTKSDPVRFKLTDKGWQAYREQTFHKIYSDLLAAKGNRIISMIAIIISIVTMVITLL